MLKALRWSQGAACFLWAMYPCNGVWNEICKQLVQQGTLQSNRIVSAFITGLNQHARHVFFFVFFDVFQEFLRLEQVMTHDLYPLNINCAGCAEKRVSDHLLKTPDWT